MNEAYNPYNDPELKEPQPVPSAEPVFNEPPKNIPQQEPPQYGPKEPPRYAQQQPPHPLTPPQPPTGYEPNPMQPPKPPTRYEPPYMPNKAEPNRYYPQQDYTNQARPVQRDPKASARVFGMISFIIGCFVLPVTSMIYFNFRSSVNDKFAASVFFGMFLSLPAIIFGVLALMKKTDKKLFPALGITFAGILLLCGFITYFFMVNGPTGGHTYY